MADDRYFESCAERRPAYIHQKSVAFQPSQRNTTGYGQCDAHAPMAKYVSNRGANTPARAMPTSTGYLQVLYRERKTHFGAGNTMMLDLLRGSWKKAGDAIPNTSRNGFNTMCQIREMWTTGDPTAIACRYTRKGKRNSAADILLQDPSDCDIRIAMAGMRERIFRSPLRNLS